MATSNIFLTEAYASVFSPGTITAASTTAPVQVYIMGGSPLSMVDRTAYLLVNTLSISWETGGKGRASMKLYDPSGSLTYGGGEEITIWAGTTKLFGGNLDRVKFSHENGTATKLYLELSCVDYSQRMERRVITELTLTAGMSLRNAADAIIDQFFDGEGFTLSSVVASVSLADDLVLSNVTVGEGLRRLCEIFNVDLNIEDRVISMGTFIGTSAPYTIRDNDNNHDEITVERNRTTYRNVQYVATGSGIETSRTETFVGDGVGKVYTLLFPVSEIQEIRVNNVEQTVDLIRAATWTFGYSVGDRRIWHTPSAAALTSTQTLSVTYTSSNTDTVAYTDAAQIAARAALEGNSGKHESVYRFFGVQDSALADQIAQSRQERLGDEGIPIEVQFVSQRTGWKPAQIVDINVSYPPVDAELLIHTVTASIVDKQIWKYTVSCRAKADGTPARQPLKTTDVIGGSQNTTYGTSYNNTTNNGGYIEARFALATNGPSGTDDLEVGANVGNPWTIVQSGQSVSATIDATKNPPTGSSIIVQLRINTASEAAIVTADAGTDRITHTAHGRADGDKVVFSSSGAVPSPLVAGTTYYTRDTLTDTYKLAATRGGTAINLSDAGSGVITATFTNFALGDPLEFPVGRTTPRTYAMGGYNMAVGKAITCDVLQVGSTNPGSDVTVVVKYARN